MAFLIAAPFIGVGVVWLSDVEAFWGPQQSAPSAEQYDIRFSRCNGSFRTTCVIDGDTFWLEGGKIRIADINTPEISNPECEAERVLGERAAERLILLLNAGGISLEAVDRDEDAFGRKLRIVTRGGESIGATLVEEGLAEVWRGSRRSWC